MSVPSELLEFIRQYRSFIVVGHKEPDGDCVGSQIALASALGRLGKACRLVNAGPFERTEISAEADRFDTDVQPHTLDSSTAAIVVDCSTADRIDRIAKQIAGVPLAVIDHHASGESFGDVRYIDPVAPANTVLIYRLIDALGLTPNSEEAHYLFFGLATDTGFFRFLDSRHADCFRIAADLVDRGASPRLIHRSIYAGKSIESRLLLARMIKRVETYAGGRFMLTYQTAADYKQFGPRRDTDALHNLLLAVDGVELLGVIREMPEGNGCAVSLRSTSSIDVGRLAAEFGGGGHQKAAGFFREQPLTVTRGELRRRFADLSDE